jgi:hypothetical protein
MLRFLFALLALALLCTFSPTPLRADDKDDARSALATQLKLLKDGKVDELKAHFTTRLRDKITPALVEQGKKAGAKYTLDDLVASVEIAQQGGTKAAKIKMKNGRTLTTLLLTDGKWLADTIWFK